MKTYTLLLFFVIAPFHNYTSIKKVSFERAYLRIFKHEKVLELWVSKNGENTFFLYKKYPICMLSGKFGPKRKEGDLQVPEGIYEANEFNPHSNYRKAIGINYPNKSDSILSPYQKKGGSIYIHGNCVSVGCVAVGDKNIDEIYSLTINCRKTIVHIFPADFDKSQDYIQNNLLNRVDLIDFESNLYQIYLYFNEVKTLPPIIISDSGKYVISNN